MKGYLFGSNTFLTSSQEECYLTNIKSLPPAMRMFCRPQGMGMAVTVITFAEIAEDDVKAISLSLGIDEDIAAEKIVRITPFQVNWDLLLETKLNLSAIRDCFDKGFLYFVLLNPA